MFLCFFKCIAGTKKTNEELEEMLENGFPGTFSFSVNYLFIKFNFYNSLIIQIMIDIEKAKQAANEIEARHRDITKLETSISELHEMFLDLARLVSTQVEHLFLL
jgi:hypothetical protein